MGPDAWGFEDDTAASPGAPAGLQPDAAFMDAWGDGGDSGGGGLQPDGDVANGWSTSPGDATNGWSSSPGPAASAGTIQAFGWDSSPGGVANGGAGPAVSADTTQAFGALAQAEDLRFQPVAAAAEVTINIMTFLWSIVCRSLYAWLTTARCTRT